MCGRALAFHDQCFTAGIIILFASRYGLQAGPRSIVDSELVMAKRAAFNMQGMEAAEHSSYNVCTSPRMIFAIAFPPFNWHFVDELLCCP